MNSLLKIFGCAVIISCFAMEKEREKEKTDGKGKEKEKEKEKEKGNEKKGRTRRDNVNQKGNN
jgi:hypothetical protein